MANNERDTQQEKLIDWINFEISEQSKYHHHKENIAWLATAFYWTAIVALSFTIAPSLTNISQRVIACILTVIIGLIVAHFIWQQFKARMQAHNDIKSLFSKREDLLRKMGINERIFPEPGEGNILVGLWFSSIFLVIIGTVIAIWFLLNP